MKNSRLQQYPISLASTFLTSFAQLGEVAQDLLQTLAWFSPAPIPESLLDKPPLTVAEGGESKEELYAALAELAAYSLVTRTNNCAGFSVQRLVQELSRPDDDPQHSHLLNALLWLKTAFAADPKEGRNWPRLEPLAAHAQSVAEYADHLGYPFSSARLMTDLGTLYAKKSLNNQAERLMKRAAEINKASFKPDHPSFSSKLNPLALLFHHPNRLAAAELHNRQALEIFTNSFGANHPYTKSARTKLRTLCVAKRIKAYKIMPIIILLFASVILFYSSFTYK